MTAKAALGTHVDVRHLAATPVGFTVSVEVESIAGKLGST